MGIYNYGGSPFAPGHDPRKGYYESEPQKVFTNWLHGLNIPEGRREEYGGLYNLLSADYHKQVSLDTENAPMWFGDYLEKQGLPNLNQQLSKTSFGGRGIDPRRFSGRTRWMGF